MPDTAHLGTKGFWIYDIIAFIVHDAISVGKSKDIDNHGSCGDLENREESRDNGFSRGSEARQGSKKGFFSNMDGQTGDFNLDDLSMSAGGDDASNHETNL